MVHLDHHVDGLALHVEVRVLQELGDGCDVDVAGAICKRAQLIPSKIEKPRFFKRAFVAQP